MSPEIHQVYVVHKVHEDEIHIPNSKAVHTQQEIKVQADFSSQKRVASSVHIRGPSCIMQVCVRWECPAPLASSAISCWWTTACIVTNPLQRSSVIRLRLSSAIPSPSHHGEVCDPTSAEIRHLRKTKFAGPLPRACQIISNVLLNEFKQHFEKK